MLGDRRSRLLHTLSPQKSTQVGRPFPFEKNFSLSDAGTLPNRSLCQPEVGMRCRHNDRAG